MTRLSERLTIGGTEFDEVDDRPSAVSERLRFWPTDLALRVAFSRFTSSFVSTSDGLGMSWRRGADEKCRVCGADAI